MSSPGPAAWPWTRSQTRRVGSRRDTGRVTSLGQVRVWHDEDGWGILDADATPGGCWVHGSSVLVAGYRRLRPGQGVRFTFEAADQDGYRFRAVEAWPAEQAPVRDDDALGSSSAYRSTLTRSVGDEEDGGARL